MIDQVIETVAGFYNQTPLRLKSTDRSKSICRARHVAMYLLRSRGLELAKIGAIFDRDHTTVLSSNKWVEVRMNDKSVVFDSALRDEVDYLEKRLHEVMYVQG